MHNYIIVTESGADLSPELISRYNIQVATMSVEMDGVEYPDDDTLTTGDVCHYYDTTGKVPKTAAAGPDQYSKLYDKILAMNPVPTVIHVCYAAKLSCGFQNAQIAAEGRLTIHQVDTGNVAGGLAFIVEKTAELIERYPDIELPQLLDRIKTLSEGTHFSFIPGNLHYLRAGGRVSNAQFLGASVLRLKPLIELIDGLMISTKKYRGKHNKIILQMIEEFFTRYQIDKKNVIMVHCHTLDQALAKEIDAQLTKLEVGAYKWLPCGRVITSHAGPDGLGIAGIEEKTYNAVFAPLD